MLFRLIPFSCLIIVLFALGCVEKEPLPARTEIPKIKEKVSRVELGVREHNQALLDSLMSVKMLDAHLTSDSLIRLVWNNIPSARFARFADCEVTYTKDIAQCDCRITDDAGQKYSGIKLTFASEGNLWLLRDFKLTAADSAK